MEGHYNNGLIDHDWQVRVAQSLASLNEQFLSLLVDEYLLVGGVDALCYPTLPPAQLHRLVDIAQSRPLHCALHNVPLFVLTLAALQSNQAAIESVAHTATSPPTLLTRLQQARSQFITCAVFFAWHLAQQDPVMARVVLDADEAAVTQFTATPLWQLRDRAVQQPQLLAPRWIQHRYFWPKVLDSLCTGEAQQLTAVQLLGVQLMAYALYPKAALYTAAKHRSALA